MTDIHGRIKPPPLLHLVVHGRPGTAGSKSGFAIYAGSGPDRRFTGRVNVAEKPSKTKASWAAAVAEAARQAIACDCGDPGCVELLPGYPLDTPLIAAMVFTVPALASAPKLRRTWPDKRPDLLKYCRAVEDHLTAAGVLKDDARIVRYDRMEKTYPGQATGSLPTAGVIVDLWRAADLDDSARPDSIMDAPDTLFGAT